MLSSWMISFWTYFVIVFFCVCVCVCVFFFLEFRPLEISAYQTYQKDSLKSILAGDLKLSQLTESNK